MAARQALPLTLAVIALALAPGMTFAATRSAAAAPTPVQAVTTLLAPFSRPGGSHGACDALTGRVLVCPITARLLYRLQHYRQGENGNLVCRCQNPPRAIRWIQTDNNGFVAHVNTRWLYGGMVAYSITFVVGREEDGWRVDDAYCAGRPQTSVYNPPTGPCP